MSGTCLNIPSSLRRQRLRWGCGAQSGVISALCGLFLALPRWVQAREFRFRGCHPIPGTYPWGWMNGQTFQLGCSGRVSFYLICILAEVTVRSDLPDR